MYPELFTVFGYTVSTFGLMLATAFLVGSWIAGLRMAEEGLDPEQATTILIYVIIGGIVGSKLYYAIDVSIRHDRPIAELLFARDGITWYGGLIMATIVGAVGCRIHGISVLVFANCTAVANTPPAMKLGEMPTMVPEISALRIVSVRGLTVPWL